MHLLTTWALKPVPKLFPCSGHCSSRGLAVASYKATVPARTASRDAAGSHREFGYMESVSKIQIKDNMGAHSKQTTDEAAQRSLDKINNANKEKRKR